MKTFSCVCGNWIHFHNSLCECCGRLLGFLPDHLVMSAVEPAGDTGSSLFRALNPLAGNGVYRQCDNYRFQQVCNWLIAPGDDAIYCRACRLNHTIPDLSISENCTRWYHTEDAKRRLLYTLFRLRLPVVGRDQNPESGLCFDFLADPAAGDKVYTGHDNGLITINLDEADPSRREQMRQIMGERYRTLLGHFRHEIGHYYWDKLVDQTHWLPKFRMLFGDERADYDDCLKRHYNGGPATGWQADFVSSYASAHPWEDWAECWAHYLHITDTLETAADGEFAVRGTPMLLPQLLLDTPSPAAHRSIAFARQLADWRHMALAMNAVNRSMGMPDPYPFVLSERVQSKLYFIHRVVARASACQQRGQQLSCDQALAPEPRRETV